MRIGGNGSLWGYPVRNSHRTGQDTAALPAGQIAAAEKKDCGTDNFPSPAEPDAGGPAPGSKDFGIGHRIEHMFELAGEDRNIHTLDMHKAISDMKRDRVLEEYQYFVGDRGTGLTDGTVIRKN